MQIYGANAWKTYNEKVEQTRQQLSAEAAAVQREVEQVNLARKTEQLPVGRRLLQLEEEWRDLATRNRSLALAIATLEQELVTLQRTVTAT